MALKKRQKEAIELMKEGENVFLSGEAGTGKSYVIDQFKEHLDRNGIKYVVAAPTGLAALNVGGTTLHRMFGLSTEIFSQSITMYNVEEVEVIIIDEISMCRKDIFQKIAREIMKFRNPPLVEDEIEHKRCRDKQIIVVGDFFQLPPVLTKKDLEAIDHYKEVVPEWFENGDNNLSKDEIYAFQCKEWEQLGFKTVVLNEVIRQDDKDYIDNLNKIRRGNAEGLEFINNNSSKTEVDKAIYLCGTNAEANAKNTNNLNKIKSEERIYWSEEEGEVEEEDRVTQRKLVLKVGARVMSVVNVNRNIANGLMGTVLKLKKDSVVVEMDNGIVHDFKRNGWPIKGFVKKKVKDDNGKEKEQIVKTSIGMFSQIPLKLAWAITVHKSQGQTYEAVNLNASKCFNNGQLYVALSRAKNLEKLHITSTLTDKNLKTSDVVKEFYEKIEQERQKEAIEVDIVDVKEVFEDKKIVETTPEGKKTTTKTKKKKTSTKANKELVDNFKKEEIKDFEVEEEYIFMKIPRSLEKVVERVLNGEVNINSQSEDIKALEDKIKSLEQELEKANRRRSKIPKLKEQEILELRKQGFGMNKIAKLVGVGDGTVRRVLIEYGVK